MLPTYLLGNHSAQTQSENKLRTVAEVRRLQMDQQKPVTKSLTKDKEQPSIFLDDVEVL